MSDTDTWPRLEDLERTDRIDDLEHTAHAIATAAPELPEDPTPVLDLARTAVLGRRVLLPPEAIRSLGIGELARVAELAGVASIAALNDRMRGPGREMVLVAMAYMLALRLEPDATWEDAQRWRVEAGTATPDPPISSVSS
jgi:hypothetical protein